MHSYLVIELGKEAVTSQPGFQNPICIMNPVFFLD